MSSPDISPGEPLPVAPIGLDNRQRAALEMVFKNQCKAIYRLVDDPCALAWIVDLDHFRSGALIKEWEEQWGSRPALYLSVRDGIVPPSPTSLFLHKPFHLPDFVSVMLRLDRLARQHRPAPPPPPPDGVVTDRVRISVQSLAPRAEARTAAYTLAADQHHPFVGTAPDVDLDDPAQVDGVFYDPDQFLQGHVARAWRQAEARRTPMGLCEPWPLVRLCPDRGLAGLDLDHGKLRPFATVPNPRARECLTPLADSAPLGGEVLPYEVLMWKLALWASRGRLPRGTPLDVPIFVRFWPNFTRLDLTPYALAITALWARKPHSLKDTVAILGAPQRFVFAFYSAAHALQLAAPTSRAVDQMFAPEALPPPPQRGLLRRILERLRN